MSYVIQLRCATVYEHTSRYYIDCKLLNSCVYLWYDGNGKGCLMAFIDDFSVDLYTHTRIKGDVFSWFSLVRLEEYIKHTESTHAPNVTSTCYSFMDLITFWCEHKTICLLIHATHFSYTRYSNYLLFTHPLKFDTSKSMKVKFSHWKFWTQKYAHLNIYGI